MFKSPIISVLMPVYNAEKYVVEAVESILNQTFDNFEFLIIDDGSSDGSLAILKRYAKKDQRIHLVSRPNTGYVVALNEMLSRAKGEFIARMDADDIALPQRFARQIEFLQREADVLWVGGAFELIDEEGRLLKRIELAQSNDEIQQLLLVGHTSYNHPSAMIRRASLIEVGGYDEAMMPAEDLDLWLKLSEIGSLANLKDTILKYRIHANSISVQDRTVQLIKIKEAFARAWRRRGIEARVNVSEECIWRPGPERSSRYKFMLQYGWWAFNSSQRQTAITYGTKAITFQPFKREGWKLLACAALKILPSHDSK